MATGAAHVLVEHREPLSPERLVQLFERCGPARYEGRGVAVTSSDRERWAATAQSTAYAQAYAWDVPGVEGLARVNFALRATAFPFRGLDPDRTFHILLDHALEGEEESAWLARYLAAIDASFGVSFAFADTEHHLRENAKADPRKLAWPVMMLGSEHAARLAGAPALVEPGGDRFFVRIGEAPLSARARALEALAQHLGRRARA